MIKVFVKPVGLWAIMKSTKNLEKRIRRIQSDMDAYGQVSVNGVMRTFNLGKYAEPHWSRVYVCEKDGYSFAMFPLVSYESTVDDQNEVWAVDYLKVES